MFYMLNDLIDFNDIDKILMILIRFWYVRYLANMMHDSKFMIDFVVVDKLMIKSYASFLFRSLIFRSKLFVRAVKLEFN